MTLSPIVGKTASVKIFHLTRFQYLTIPSIHFDLFFLNKKDYEFSVRSAWIAILGNYFPRNHGYSHDIEARNNVGWPDILVRALPAGPHLFDMRPPPFLTIQCKKVKYETRDSEWLGAKHQLQRYFRGIYDGYNSNSPASGGPKSNNVYSHHWSICSVLSVQSRR